MSDKFFPIKTETACQLKWNWSTIRLHNGVTSSCHRASLSNITADNFDSFHNTTEKIDARTLMLNGQWPTGGCEYCQKIESAGGTSDRMFHAAIPNMAPSELDVNPLSTEITPTILEIGTDLVAKFSKRMLSLVDLRKLAL